MSEIKKTILDIIFWLALIIGIIMVLWRIFRNSPTDIAVISPFIVMILSKLWTINNEYVNFRSDVKMSFNKVKEDISRIENKIDGLKPKSRRK